MRWVTQTAHRRVTKIVLVVWILNSIFEIWSPCDGGCSTQVGVNLKSKIPELKFNHVLRSTVVLHCGSMNWTASECVEEGTPEHSIAVAFIHRRSRCWGFSRLTTDILPVVRSSRLNRDP